MARDIKRHIQLLKSSGVTEPTASDLLYGEIAVGYGKGNEVLYIKNSNDEIIPFTNSISALAEAQAYADSGDVTTVTGDSEISVTLSEKNASGRTITITHASGSAQSGFKKLESDSYGHITGGSNVELSDLVGLGALSGVSGENGITASTKADGSQTIGHTNNITAGTAQGTETKTLAFGEAFDIPSVTYDANGHITASGTTTLTLPTQSADFITSIDDTADISLDVTSGKLTATHTNTITAGSAKTSSSEVTATPSGANINIPTIGYDANGHISSVGSENVSLKVNAASTSVAGVVQLVATTGNDETTVMTQKAVTDELATKALATSAITNAEYDSTNKLIKFTNAAGTQVDSINAADFIKDGMVSNVEIKEVAESGSCLVVTFNTDSGKDAINIPLTSIFDPSNYYTKSQTSGATELSNEFALYYKKTETSSATEINDAFAENELVISTALNDLNTRLSAHTDDSDIHVTAADKANWNGKANSATTLAGYGITDAYTKTEVDTALTAKTDLTVHTALNDVVTAHTANTDIHVTAADKTAWNAKLDSSALNDYYTKSETSGATEISNALAAKADTATTYTKTEVDAALSGKSDTGHTHEEYANQNAFSNIIVGSTTVEADSTTDTVTFAVSNTTGSDGLTISADATNDSVTINLGDIICGDYA